MSNNEAKMPDHCLLSTSDVIREITEGRFDSDLDLISGVLRERKRLTRQSRARVACMTTKVGQTGVLEGLSPKYINGVAVKVTKINQTKLVVEPVEPKKLPTRTAKKLGVYLFGDGENFTCYGVTVPAGCFKAD